jgi:zinc finger protein
MTENVAIAPALDAEDVVENHGVTEVESLCVNCEENGMSKFLIVRVPYFRDIVICAFDCPHCGFRSNEVQSVDGVAQTGACKYTLTVDCAAMLNRQVIKSNYASIIIPELQFEIPSITQRGEINTIEGFISNAADNLEQGQVVRRAIDPETTDKIQVVIDQLFAFARGEAPFTFVLDDPSGNSFVENPLAPNVDPKMDIEHYVPSKEQLKVMGFLPDEEDAEEEKKIEDASSGFGGGFQVSAALKEKLDTYFDVTEKMAQFPGICHSCSAIAEVRMCMTEIPNFGPIVIMVSECDQCGYKDSEVKPGGAVGEFGKKISLKVTSIEDLSRDLLKSDSAALYIPEVDLELQSGTLGGKYTTVEGILEDIYNQLTESNPFQLGDSAEESDNKFKTWLEEFHNLKSCTKPFTLIIDDPLGNVFIHNPHFPKDDPAMTIEIYERTFEQNEELGLNDINTEDYENQEE